MAQAQTTRTNRATQGRVCFGCGQPLPHGVAECGNCGRVIRSARRDSASAVSAADAGPDKATLQAQSQAALAKLRATIASDTNSFNRKVWVCVATLLMGAGWTYLHDLPGGWPIGLGVAAFLGLNQLRSANRWLYRSEYYSLPSATFPNGDRRCISCGNQGIWRQGEYKGNTTYACCSKCKRALFIE